MPTVHQQGGFNVRIYPTDHEPPHVHCIHGREDEAPSAIFFLNGEDGSEPGVVKLRQNKGLTSQELRSAKRVVKENLAKLLQEWKERND